MGAQFIKHINWDDLATSSWKHLFQKQSNFKKFEEIWRFILLIRSLCMGHPDHMKNELEEALLETRGCCAATCARVASCFVLMRSRICTSELGAGKRRKKAKRTTEQHDSIFLWLHWEDYN